jgi:hypothetical protein
MSIVEEGFAWPLPSKRYLPCQCPLVEPAEVNTTGANGLLFHAAAAGDWGAGRFQGLTSIQGLVKTQFGAVEREHTRPTKVRARLCKPAQSTTAGWHFNITGVHHQPFTGTQESARLNRAGRATSWKTVRWDNDSGGGRRCGVWRCWSRRAGGSMRASR